MPLRVVLVTDRNEIDFTHDPHIQANLNWGDSRLAVGRGRPVDAAATGRSGASGPRADPQVDNESLIFAPS